MRCCLSFIADGPFFLPQGNRRLSIGARILLVEDNITNQKVAVRMLTRLGQRCDIAENGLQVFIPQCILSLLDFFRTDPMHSFHVKAVHAVCNNDYLLVLMDMRLPGMDGLTATQEIREAEREGRTASEKPCAIIAMTADASPEFRETVRALLARVAGFLALTACSPPPRHSRWACRT